jgi:hypothetical protein
MMTSFRRVVSLTDPPFSRAALQVETAERTAVAATDDTLGGSEVQPP